jgi:ketosteroid isomerase-like protein
VGLGAERSVDDPLAAGEATDNHCDFATIHFKHFYFASVARSVFSFLPAERVFAEYEVEALVPSTGKIYRQMYAGRLVARDGKIARLREALDTVAAAEAFAGTRAA